MRYRDSEIDELCRLYAEMIELSEQIDHLQELEQDTNRR